MTTTGNWDFFIYAFFFIAVFIYGMAIQKGMSIVMIISVYLALGVTVLMSSGNIKGETPAFFEGIAEIKAIIFATSVFVISYYMISNGPLLSVVKNETGGMWWEKVLYGIAFSGLFVVTLLYLATPEQQITFMQKTSEGLQSFLMSDSARKLWSIFPFAIFFLTNKS